MSMNRHQSVIRRLALMISLLIGPGLILLSSRDRWDGVLAEYIAGVGRLGALDNWLMDSGWVLLWVFIRALLWLSANLDVQFWWLAKLLLAGELAWLAWETQAASRRILDFSPEQAHWVACLTLVFPGYVLFHTSPHIGVGMFVCWAFCGHRLSHSSHAAWRVLGYALIGLSFQMASNVVFIVCMELAGWVASGRVGRRQWTRLAALVCWAALGHWVFRGLVATGGAYAAEGYNQILWPTHVGNVIRLAVTTVIWASWAALLALGPLVWLAVRRFSRGHQAVRSEPAHHQPATRAGQAVLASLVLCTGAVLPYIAAGKFAAFAMPTFLGVGQSVYGNFALEFLPGWFISGLAPPPIRHTIILGGALSIALVAVARWFSQRCETGSRVPLATASMCVAIWLHQAAWAAWAHKEKLVHGALDQSVIAGLRLVAPPPDGATIILERRQRLKAWYDSLETNILYYEAYGRASWMAATVFAPAGRSYQTAIERVEGTKATLAAARNDRDLHDFYIAGDFSNRGCTQYIVAQIPEPGWRDLLWTAVFVPRSVAPAQFVTVKSDC